MVTGRVDLTATLRAMKSLWIATGVVVGLGAAGLVAAGTGDEPGRTRNVGDGVVDLSTTSASTTTTTVGDASTTTSLVEAQTTTTARRQIVTVATMVAVEGPVADPSAPPTTEYLLHNIGDPCETVGATTRRDGHEVLMVCVAGDPNTWQPA